MGTGTGHHTSVLALTFVIACTQSTSQNQSGDAELSPDVQVAISDAATPPIGELAVRYASHGARTGVISANIINGELTVIRSQSAVLPAMLSQRFCSLPLSAAAMQRLVELYASIDRDTVLLRYPDYGNGVPYHDLSVVYRSQLTFTGLQSSYSATRFGLINDENNTLSPLHTFLHDLLLEAENDGVCIEFPYCHLSPPTPESPDSLGACQPAG